MEKRTNDLRKKLKNKTKKLIAYPHKLQRF